MNEQFPLSKLLIHTLKIYTYNRTLLAAELLVKQSEIEAQEGHSTEQAQSSASATELLSRLDIQINEQRVQSLLSTANALYSLGDKAKADTLYVKVLDYSYDDISDPQAYKLFENSYRQAAVGLINSRQNNVAALQQIFLRPWARVELGPYLQQVIRQAKERTAATPHP